MNDRRLIGSAVSRSPSCGRNGEWLEDFVFMAGPFTVPWSLYEKMLKALPESMFNVDGDWTSVRKKVDRSAKTWGENG